MGTVRSKHHSRPGRSRWAGRLWQSPLWAHAVALAAVLGVALVLTRPLVAYATDEGAAIIQAEVLNRTGQWILPVPTHALDPRDRAQPIPHDNEGPKGRAPYAKHPLYPLILVGAFVVAGNLGYVLLSVLGTLAAAVLAALLAGRIRAGADRLVLWGVGVASPLFFDGTWVLAHSLAAASAAGAALLIVIACERASAGPKSTSGLTATNLALMGAGAACVALATGVRTEGAILGAALAMGALVWGAARRRWLGAVAALLSVAAVVAVRYGERLASDAILGSSAVEGVPSTAASSSAPAPGSWLLARVDAIRTTLLTPSYVGGPKVVLLVVGAALMLAAGVTARLGRPPARVMALGGVATLAYVLWFPYGDRYAVPGLLIACPAIGASVVCVDRRLLEQPTALLLSVTAAAAVAGVVLTEYYYGGGTEWGGRFFAFVIPLAAAPLGAAVAGLASPQRRALVAGLAATGMATAGLALASVRAVHHAASTDAAAVGACARIAGPPGSPALDRRPLIVTSWRFFPQGMWKFFFDYQWLAPESSALDRYLGTAADHGVQRLVLVSLHPKDELPAPGFRQMAACRAPALTVVVLQRN